jgi:hypothetical protein
VKPSELAGESEHDRLASRDPAQSDDPPVSEPGVFRLRLEPSPLPASPDRLGERFLERATGREPAPQLSEELSAEEWAAMPDAEREQFLRRFRGPPAPGDALFDPQPAGDEEARDEEGEND